MQNYVTNLRVWLWRVLDWRKLRMIDLDTYEKQRLEKLNAVTIGKTDTSGRVVYDIYVKADEFAIYSIAPEGLIRNIAIDIETKDPNNLDLVNCFQAVKGEFDKLKAISDRAGDKSYSARVAHALSVAIYGKPDDAKIILREIYVNIIEDYKERVKGKIIYLSGTFMIALIINVFALYLYICQPELIVNNRHAFYELSILCAFSTLGGFVSVSRGLTKIDVEKGLGPWPYLLHGVERNIFSIIGGTFIYVLIKSNLLFGFVNSLAIPFYGLMAFGFLAGFSETLIPNALKNLENRANKESNHTIQPPQKNAAADS